ncbi:DUF4199 domain-containing protein [Zeaxanthinibacter enoshimensis]|uniref:Uncharacterized protein DUF4199 n=1 Tax=Zeaxanthinibacter enoshimensis TaxID=392009 RepID=A0A4V3D3F8_9FLAO|nr:DUF4199 domain-containing protein [Zeaxanthinibacter enoshimensis]TDQ29434.1 uncharacterized protein DUF4199 [Zeaxanthinibacter enoshimensis]
METKPPTTGKFSLTYGAILGGLSIIFALMLFSMDAHTSREPLNQVISVVMSAAVIVFGIHAYKKANEGYLTLSEALKLGAGISLVSALIFIVYQLILTNFLDPDFASKVMDIQMAELVESGQLTADQAAQQKEMGMKFFWIGYPVILIISIISGLIIGLIAGLVMKKSRPAY